MATKEDILEQVVEEYLLHEGYFVQHNLKFRPSRDHPDYRKNNDSNHSDIDVIGYHPQKTDFDRVVVVSCKSWQNGFYPGKCINAIVNDKELSGRPAWKSFRELVVPKWSEAFISAVENVSGTKRFTYVTAVTRLHGNKSSWEQHKPFQMAIGNNKIRIWTLKKMTEKIQEDLTTTLARTEVGRMLQLFKAASIK